MTTASWTSTIKETERQTIKDLAAFPRELTFQLLVPRKNILPFAQLTTDQSPIHFFNEMPEKMGLNWQGASVQASLVEANMNGALQKIFRPYQKIPAAVDWRCRMRQPVYPDIEFRVAVTFRPKVLFGNTYMRCDFTVHQDDKKEKNRVCMKGWALLLLSDYVPLH